MYIRRAKERDIEGINRLLYQVLAVHHKGRPDIFKENTKKYTDEQLKEIIYDKNRPVFVAADDDESVIGYAFCITEEHKDNNVLCDIKTLYIDDLCVDEKLRGKRIGKSLYEHVVSYARNEGFYNVTLNVWACNPDAVEFYKKCGLVPQKIGMEKIL